MQNNNNYLLKMNMIKGFTLAEILITIGIIGIIASLTIPQLIQNAQDKELRTLWKKSTQN